MSSLVRRSLRTTAVAAGIAAVSAGLAGPAFAAPDFAAPELSAPEGLADGPEMPQGDYGVPGILEVGMTKTTAAAPALPSGDAFVVPSAPGIDTPETGAAPGSEATDASSAVNNEDGSERVNGPSADNVGQGNVGALQGIDMAAFVMEMAHGAAAG